MVHHSECPVCSSIRLSHRFDCTDYLISHKAFAIMACEDCGFNFTQDAPDENEAGKYYESEEYISHSDKSSGIVSKLYKLARSLMLKRKTRLVKAITDFTSGRILDIGSGTGYFLNAMKLSGWQAEGIEINEKARSFSRTEFGVEVHEPAKISNLTDSIYDCITLWHTLEHFHDPGGYMRQITRLLKPDGKIIIALPNCSSYDAQFYRESWAAWDVPRHLWHFSPGTFRRFVENEGFQIMSIRPLPLDVFYISMLSEKNRKTRLHLPAGAIKGLWFWLKALFNKERYSSLIYILKKSVN